MRKKLRYVIVFITIILLGIFIYDKRAIFIKKNLLQQNVLTPTPTMFIPKRTKTIFIPAWSLTGKTLDISGYDRLVYFAIAPGRSGIDKNESGYLNLDRFAKLFSTGSNDNQGSNVGKQKLLTLRMHDDAINQKALADLDFQTKIISDSLEIVNKYKFVGLVLDLEMAGLFNPDTKLQIAKLVQNFYTKLKVNNLKLAVGLYGDNFYRSRPYDVGTIAKNSDEIMIMAYDFSKANGEPGPNFPFSSRQVISTLSARLKYSYDFQNMTDDFLKSGVPPEKITVIFGMYGYHWIVDEKKRPIMAAKPITLAEVKKEYLNQCKWQDCIVKRDDVSRETEVDYVVSQVKDNFGYLYYHIVWFEDEESVATKSDYLLKKGIGSTAYWAYGYF